MADQLDQLMARGVISDRAAAAAQDARDAAAQRMIRATVPGERQEGALSPQPEDVGRFFQGGVPGVLKGRGVDVPEWMERAGDVIHSPAFNDALGVTFPAAKWARFQDLLKAGKPFGEIAGEFGITESAAKWMAENGGPRGGITDVWSAPGSVDRLQELAAQGRSQTQIAQELGLSGKTVARKAKELGIEVSPGETVAERSARIKRESPGYEKE